MICLKDNIGLKYMIKINVSCLFYFFNMADRKFTITIVAHIFGLHISIRQY